MLGRLPAKLTIIGIEGRSFETGGSPSTEVLEAVALIETRFSQTPFSR